MDASNLTELLKANDDNKPNHADKSGGITIDVLPTGSVLLGTLKIRVLGQMPLRGNATHTHFIPVLSSPPVRPRNLPQQPHTMKTAWHYTTGQKAKMIFESGELKPTDAFIEAQEKPILWFSKNQEWEQTANKMLAGPGGTLRQLTTDETRNMGGGRVSFRYAVQ